MAESAIDWRSDGSIKFEVEGSTIRWRPPKVGHLRRARNAQSQVADATRARVADRADDEFDLELALENVEDLVAAWVRSVHYDLRLEGELPEDINDWPSWLPTLRFTLAVIEHWGSNPFASKSGPRLTVTESAS